MFIIDNILLSPMKAFMWMVRELHNAAQQEITGEADQLTHRLSTLYMMLETQQITQEDFDLQEREILTRLDEIEALQGGAEPDDEFESDDDEDQDEETGDSESQADDSESEGLDEIDDPTEQQNVTKSRAEISEPAAESDGELQALNDVPSIKPPPESDPREE